MRRERVSAGTVMPTNLVRLCRGVRWLLVGLAVLLLGLTAFAWRDLGHRAGGQRRARMEASPQWRDGRFVNPQPLRNDMVQSLVDSFGASPYVSPASLPPTVRPGALARRTPPASGLRVTWLGHSTTLVEIDGVRVLTDPVWGERVSPFSSIGPKRWFPPPVALHELPPIDAVVVSHDHYDHLDRHTVVAMRDWKTMFIVPLGVGANLVYWGIPEARVVELDWWQRTTVGGIEIVSTPARHASGRMVVDYDAKLWTGYALVGPSHRVYYSGDTGLFPAMRDIGARLGPFDLTMIEVGQYGRSWPDWHLGPEQAVRAHGLVRGKVMLPVHWATFGLAFHGWTEPVERTLVAAAAAGVVVVTPRPGESLDPTVPPVVNRWWPKVPWKTAAEDPIVATQMD